MTPYQVCHLNHFARRQQSSLRTLQTAKSQCKAKIKNHGQAPVAILVFFFRENGTHESSSVGELLFGIPSRKQKQGSREVWAFSETE